jgi:hypothetical protein
MLANLAFLFVLIVWALLYCLVLPAEAASADHLLFIGSVYFLSTLGFGIVVYLSVAAVGQFLLRRLAGD